MVIHFQSVKGALCVLIRPDALCLCAHRFKDHFMDRCGTCNCNSFRFLPGKDVLCQCSHQTESHHPSTGKCLQFSCDCKQVTLKWRCKCGMNYQQHSLTKKFKQKQTKAPKEQVKVKKVAPEQIQFNLEELALRPHGLRKVRVSLDMLPIRKL